MPKQSKKRRPSGVHHGPSILELVAQGDLGWEYSSDPDDDYTATTEELNNMHRSQELEGVLAQAVRWVEKRQQHPQNRWKAREIAAARQLFAHYIQDVELPGSVFDTLAQSQIGQIRTQFAIFCLANKITGLQAQDTDWYRAEEPMARVTRDARKSGREDARPFMTRRRAA